tara:strand:+ start:192 stop:347 length:156 start_codon:yes stop_codon:yes gene_type:complete
MKLISANQKIAVFGSSGMVGSAICRSLLRNGYKNIFSPKRKELDLLDNKSV